MMDGALYILLGIAIGGLVAILWSWAIEMLNIWLEETRK